MKKETSAMDLIKEATEQKREEIMAVAKMGVHKLKGAASVMNKSVHKTPWYYLGGVAFVGFLAGIFARSRRKSDDT